MINLREPHRDWKKLFLYIFLNLLLKRKCDSPEKYILKFAPQRKKDEKKKKKGIMKINKMQHTRWLREAFGSR